MTFRHLKKIMRNSLAGVMAVWLSGVVFLFCCQSLNAKTMEMESCPLVKMSVDCDKAKRVNNNDPVIELTDESSVDCCGFLPVVFDKSRKVERSQKQIAILSDVAVLKLTPSRPASISHSFTVFQSRVPDRHGIYIQHCVFRI